MVDDEPAAQFAIVRQLQQEIRHVSARVAAAEQIAASALQQVALQHVAQARTRTAAAVNAATVAAAHVGKGGGKEGSDDKAEDGDNDDWDKVSEKDQEQTRSGKIQDIRNPWNKFQADHSGEFQSRTGASNAYWLKQRYIRRHWDGAASDFLVRMSEVVEQKMGVAPAATNFDSLPARRGSRWHWKHPNLGGSIELQLPSGMVLVRGNDEQIEDMIDMLKEFTSPWTGDLTLKPSKARQRQCKCR